MLLRAKNEGLLDVARSCQVGLRTYNDSDHGFEILTAPWIHRHGVALEIVRGLSGLDLVGADVVEVAPAYDVSEITALAAATIAHDILCLMALRKGAVGRPVGRLR